MYVWGFYFFFFFFLGGGGGGDYQYLYNGNMVGLMCLLQQNKLTW